MATPKRPAAVQADDASMGSLSMVDDEPPHTPAPHYNMFGIRGGILARGSRPSEIAELQRVAKTIPGPGQYNSYNPNVAYLPKGGRFGMSTPKTALEEEMLRSSAIPGWISRLAWSADTGRPWSV